MLSLPLDFTRYHIHISKYVPGRVNDPCQIWIGSRLDNTCWKTAAPSIGENTSEVKDSQSEKERERPICVPACIFIVVILLARSSTTIINLILVKSRNYHELSLQSGGLRPAYHPRSFFSCIALTSQLLSDL